AQPRRQPHGPDGLGLLALVTIAHVVSCLAATADASRSLRRGRAAVILRRTPSGIQCFEEPRDRRGGPRMAGKTKGTGRPREPKSGMIRARVDPGLKAKVEGIFGQLGLSASDAIRIFYTQVALTNGMPFEVRVPNALTRETLEGADAGKNLTRHASVDEMFK